MSAQADRIEALLVSVAEKLDRLLPLLEQPVASTRKKKPFLTDEERTNLRNKWAPMFHGDLTAIDGHIIDALDHDAAKKRGNSGSWCRYVDKWLETEAQKQPKQANIRAQTVDNGDYMSKADRAKWDKTIARAAEYREQREARLQQG